MVKIFPAIDIRNGHCVRLKQGDYNQETIFGDNPAEMAKRWQDQGGEIVHLVDLDGAKAGKPVNLEAIKRIKETVTVPLQLGGGIRDDQSIDLLLNDIGIRQVVIGTQALKQPDWFQSVAEKYPNRITLGLDARDSFVATAGWLEVSKTPMLELAQRYVGLPLAGVVYTNIANDGMMQGVDERTLDDLCQLADMGLPVIASGGVTSLVDVKNISERAKKHPKIIGIIIGRALYDNVMTVTEAINTSRAT